MAREEQSIGIAGGGRIGKAIYHLLIDGNICNNVTVMDIAPRPDDIAKSDYVQSDGTFDRFVKGKTLIINALPYTKNVELWSECRKNNVAYFDLSEDDGLDSILGDYPNGDIPFTMPHCGLAPGMSTVIANSLLREQVAATDVKIRVGALSNNTTNKLKYHTSWSGEGLVNEYRGDCHIIRDGKFKLEPALSGYEIVTLDGSEYEAFNTSGGIGTLAWTLSKTIEHNKKLNVDYKTLRRVGHHDYADFLFNDLGLTDKELVNIFKNHVPSTQNDCVLIYVQAGDREYYKKFTPTEINGRRYTAIELTTAIGLISMVELYLEGKLTVSGYYKQEQVKLEDVLGTTYGEVYHDS